jgi:nucleoside-diphosphate-sugar epimerase
MKKISPGVADPLPSFLADKDVKVFVTGHQGLLGSTIVRCLLALNFTNVSLRVVRKDSIDVSRVKRVWREGRSTPSPFFRAWIR